MHTNLVFQLNFIQVKNCDKKLPWLFCFAGTKLSKFTRAKFSPKNDWGSLAFAGGVGDGVFGKALARDCT